MGRRLAILKFKLALFAVMHFALVGIVGRASGAESSHDAATPVAIPGVANFAVVTTGTLYRGAQPTAEGFAYLKEHYGIKTVVNLRALHGDSELLAGTNLEYKRLHCKAWHPEDEDVRAFLKIVENPANRPVFVHCAQGADRTGCMVAAYRIIEQNWPVADAVRELQNFGFHPIWVQIKSYLSQFDNRREEFKPGNPK